MIEQDTVKLLRECDAGIKMGVYSIEEVLGDVNNGNFKQMLEKAKSDHQQLQDEIQILLDKYHDDGKDPNPMAKGMSWFKTNIKISADSSDNTIADLITDANCRVRQIRWTCTFTHGILGRFSGVFSGKRLVFALGKV